MAKLWSLAFALLVSAGLWAGPAMAQSSDVDDVGKIQRGGAEAQGAANTTLGEKGLMWDSDGFSLRLTNRVQVRLTYQNEVANGNEDRAFAAGNDGFTNGRDFINFRIPRARTTFSGHIFQKEFQYELSLEWANGGDSILRNAWFRWAPMQYINVNAGQHKLPFNWEHGRVSSGKLTFVDRSYANGVFNLDYAKGIWIDGKVGDDVPWIKYWLGLYNGRLRSGSDFRNRDQGPNPDAFADGIVDGDMMVNLRVETHPLGEVAARMNDMRSSDEHDKVLFSIGLGLNWFTGGFNNAALRPDTIATPTGSGRFRTSHDTLAFVLDGHLRLFGLSVDIEFFFRHTEFHNRGRNRFNPTTPSRNGTANMSDVGFTFEVAYFILPEQLNVGIRFNHVNADEFWQGGSTSRFFGVRPDSTELGLAVNYYIHGDNLKLTLDILMVSQQLVFGAGSGGTPGSLLGVYNAPPTRSPGSQASEVADYNDLWIIRLQLQWIF